MYIYGFKDVKAGEFITIFIQKNELMALRHAAGMVNNLAYGIIATNPEDFELYCLGEFNISNGLIDACNPEFVKNLLELKQNERNQ